MKRKLENKDTGFSANHRYPATRRRMNAEEWARMCLRKHAYSERLADTIIERSRRERGVELRKYACPYCMSFHLTHIKENRRG